jgi:uncharacterized protein
VEVLAALVIVVGLAGTVVPVLPGLLLVWGGIAGWALLDGGGWIRWVVVVVAGAVAVAGYVLATLVPGRRASDAGAPDWVLLAGAVGMVVGFFVIPVVGAIVGGVGGVLVAEYARTRELRSAWRVTLETLKGFGIGAALQLFAGLVMTGVWLAGVAVT